MNAHVDTVATVPLAQRERTAAAVAGAKPYANPYVTGVGLGLVLLAAFVVMGRGLGASGAFASTASGLVASVSPATAKSSAFFARYVGDGANPWVDWLVFEIAGVAIGGVASAWLA